jgi:hypothetical protein
MSAEIKNKSSKITINIFYPLWLIFAAALGFLSLVSWWTILLVVLMGFKLEVSFKF